LNHSFCILPCKDGHILLAPFQQWETLVEWMDNEGMAEDLRDKGYLEEGYRDSRMSHIIQVIERWTKNHTVQELLSQVSLCASVGTDLCSQRVLSNSQLKARGFFVDVEHPELKDRFPIRVLRTSLVILPRADGNAHLSW